MGYLNTREDLVRIIIILLYCYLYQLFLVILSYSQLHLAVIQDYYYYPDDNIVNYYYAISIPLEIYIYWMSR